MEKALKKPEEWGTSFLLTYNAKTWTDLICNLPTSILPYKIAGYKTAIEIGENGNLHSHTFVSFERSQRKTAIINKLPTTDVKRVTSGTERSVIEYVGNTDKIEEKNCHIIDCYQWGNIETTQGLRTDLTATEAALWAIKDAIDKGANLRMLYNEFFPYMMRNGQGIRGYMEYCREEQAEKTLKAVKNVEADNAAMEAIILQQIYEKNSETCDSSTPPCVQCGKPTKWNPVENAYEEFCEECNAA